MRFLLSAWVDLLSVTTKHIERVHNIICVCGSSLAQIFTQQPLAMFNWLGRISLCQNNWKCQPNNREHCVNTSTALISSRNASSRPVECNIQYADIELWILWTRDTSKTLKPPTCFLYALIFSPTHPIGIKTVFNHFVRDKMVFFFLSGSYKICLTWNFVPVWSWYCLLISKFSHKKHTDHKFVLTTKFP